MRATIAAPCNMRVLSGMRQRPLRSVARSVTRPANVAKRSMPAPTIARRTVVRKAMMDSTPGAGLNPEVKANIDRLVNSSKVVLFMKGNRQFPQCGFSNTTVQILNMMGVPFETVDILANEGLRSGLKEYSMWPTFPQVYIGGEFVGGADIMIEMFQNGELRELLERELNS